MKCSKLQIFFPSENKNLHVFKDVNRREPKFVLITIYVRTCSG